MEGTVKPLGHCLRTYCNKNFRGWIAGCNPFCQLIEKRTLEYPGILAAGSYSPLTGINIPNIDSFARLLCTLIPRQNELANPHHMNPLRTNPLRTWGYPPSLFPYFPPIALKNPKVDWKIPNRFLSNGSAVVYRVESPTMVKRRKDTSCLRGKLLNQNNMYIFWT